MHPISLNIILFRVREHFNANGLTGQCMPHVCRESIARRVDEAQKQYAEQHKNVQPSSVVQAKVRDLVEEQIEIEIAQVLALAA